MSEQEGTTEAESTDIGIDLSDMAAVREAANQARAVGHWRRILAIYGDHLGYCQSRGGGVCDCGWLTAGEA